MTIDTTFRSDERFTQSQFADWLRRRPRGEAQHHELLDGHIVQSPPAGHPHSAVEAAIVQLLRERVRRTHAGVVHGSSAAFELPSGDTVAPDVSFVSEATRASSMRTGAGDFYAMVPDLVVEIATRSTSRRDQNGKKRIYEKNGVAEYWIVSPETRDVSVHRRGRSRYGRPIVVMNGLVVSSVLPGLAIPLDEIFADVD